MNITVSIVTLGNGADAVIWSIKAEGEGRDNFERVIDIDSCLDAGLQVDGRSLLDWKLNNEDIGRLAVPLADALKDLRDAFAWEDALVWMDMSVHHAAVLDTAYRRLRLQPPWQFYNLRDLLTVDPRVENICGAIGGLRHVS